MEKPVDQTGQIQIKFPDFINHASNTTTVTNKNLRPRYTWKKKAGSEIQKRCLCTKAGFKAFIFSFFPFLTWTKEYQWKKDAISDLIAGITVGIMSIPQGMSYAGVAGVPAVYGLYTNIFPTISYFFFGTSKLAAIGSAAVVSIMLGNTRHKHIPDSSTDFSIACYSPSMMADNVTVSDDDYSDHLDPNLSDNPDCFSSWQLINSMTMLTGIILVIMGIFRFGIMFNYLSDYLVGGFTSGAAIHAMTSQLDYIFGTHLPWHSGVGKIILTYIDLFKHIGEAIPANVIISLICISSLLIIKNLLNVKFQKMFGVPLPGELLLVLIGTAASYFGQFEERYHVVTVHSISAGFPQPLLPRFDLMQKVAIDALCLAAVLYSLSISLAKLYAKRNDYKIDDNQEFFAFGLINIVGSFFQCIAAGQIVSRSAVNESAGAKSQFAGLYGSVLVIVTILWVAPLLASLPKCILGSIIFAACIQMLKQLKQLKPLFKKSKLDFMIYLFTFLSVVLLDVKEGLVASVIFSVLVGIIRTQWSKRRNSHLGDNLYNKLDEEKTRPKDRIFRFDEPLYFANVDRFKRQVYEICGLTSDDVKKDESALEMSAQKSVEPISMISRHQRMHLNEIEMEYVIIDCSKFHYIDSMGVRALRQIDTNLQKRGIPVYYVKCTGDNLKKLITAQFLDNERKTRLFATAEHVIGAIRAQNCLKQYGATTDGSEISVQRSDSQKDI